MSIIARFLSRNFIQEACNRVWVSDITYIPTREGWLYLAGVKYLYSKDIKPFDIRQE